MGDAQMAEKSADLIPRLRSDKIAIIARPAFFFNPQGLIPLR
jgi:hypothetical protein